MALAGDLAILVVQSLWLMLPAYFGNMAPVFVGGGKPIDGGRKWRDGRRILGDGKTWRGILLGPVAATVLLVPVSFLAGVPPFAAWSVHPWGGLPWILLFGYALALGALVGDAVESFFKRRLGKERGEPWIGFDQLDFVVGAWTFGLLASAAALALGYPGFWFLEAFTWRHLLVIGLLTPALHLGVNFIGYKIGRKDVPW